MKRWIQWMGWLPAVWALSAAGQACFTPVRASWTEDSATTLTITWDTPTEARGEVRYGTTTNYTGTERDGGGLRRHAITLRGLAAGTRYFYEATSSDGFAQQGSARTAPAPGQPAHFAIHGDLQGGVSVPDAAAVAGQIVAEDPDWVVQLGDLSDEAYVAAGFATWTNFFNTCSNELARAVFMPLVGNHDDPGSADDLYTHAEGYFHRLFSLPPPEPGRGTYAYTAGSIRFIQLNTEWPPAEQVRWLARELQAAANDTNVTWVIAACHRPPYSWGERAGDDTVKDAWAHLFVKYEADWLFSGHSHNYQRIVPIRGVRYLITGGAGASLYDSAVGHASHLFATTCYHHVSVHVTNDVMQLRGIRSDGLVFDSATVTNRRQVRVAPAFPLRGGPAKISYRATEGPLAAASPVHIHLGVDAFTSAWTNAAMTWNAATARWEYEFTVPAAVTNRLAFLFCDAAGTNWHNNYTNNWQALLGRTSMTPAVPGAGSNAILRYEADLGPLAGATQVTAWVAFNGGDYPATNGLALTNVAGARWEGPVAVPPYAEDLVVEFSSGSTVDDDDGRRWSFATAGTTNAAWPPAPFAANGTPVITANPEGAVPDNPGDNFDLATDSPPVDAQDDLPGFGDWGFVWANADATNLYLGGHGLDLGGSNNVPILFLGVDTLTDNAWNLWHKAGLPNALDYLHNVLFTEPMDVAIVLGDTYGDDPAYINFEYGGHDFGQGVYYIGTNAGSFVAMGAAAISQFHGTGTVACADGGSGAARRTTRWEVALPWSALGAAGPTAASNLFICGVIASSSVSTNDRYLSRTCLGAQAWGKTDGYGQYAYNVLTIRPLRVNLLHADLLGDGLSNGWRQAQFGSPAGPPAGEDSDGDGFDNRAEEIAGTHPLDAGSAFALHSGAAILNWPFAAQRFYDVSFTTNLLQPFAPLATGLATNAYTPATGGYFRVQVRK